MPQGSSRISIVRGGTRTAARTVPVSPAPITTGVAPPSPQSPFIVVGSQSAICGKTIRMTMATIIMTKNGITPT